MVMEEVTMNSDINRRPFALLAAFALVLGTLAGCDDSTTNPGPDPGENNDTASVLLKFNVSTTVGNTPFVLDSMYTSEAGTEYKVSKFLYYVYGIMLVDTLGNSIPVPMVNADSTPVLYNTVLVDYRKPETMSLQVLAKRGPYRGVRLAVGIPQFDSAGNMVNHVDASAMEYPLNVDADMYWGWKSGYIFLKIEGRSRSGDTLLPFFYHVGDDSRFMPISMDMPFTVKGDGSTVRTLAVNVNRLFVTPFGQHSPNMAGTLSERVTHGGTTADIVSGNAKSSGFMTLK